jgi:hypothetical protein
VRVIRIPCDGAVSGSSHLTAGPWTGLCEKCHQTVECSGLLAIPTMHYREVAVSDDIAELYLPSQPR